MVNKTKKVFRDLVKDLKGMGIVAVHDVALDLFKVAGVTVVTKAKQGTCVVNCNGCKSYPVLYFGKYGVNMTQMGNTFHYIIPILK